PVGSSSVATTVRAGERWVTGEQARAWVHRLRDQVDVILVGATTVQRDNPQLTTRLAEGTGKDPVRVVVDSHLRLSPKLTVFTQRSPARTVVATLEDPTGRKAKRFAATGAEVWQMPAKQGRVDLEALMRRLAKEGLNHVLVEGGAEMYGSFLRGGLADELLLFVAPKLIGGEGLSWSGSLGVKQMARALTVGKLSFEQVGEDLLLRARLSHTK
ncbi:MAG TPA: RibD family protein, partial [Archangium sp.]|nr:RibD family protein [Archangium sp.]